MKLWQICTVLAVAAALFLLVSPAMAQPPVTTPTVGPAGTPSTSYLISGAGIGAGIGIAITILGAGWGFGRIGGSALESMARQPEVADKVRGAMIVIAALLEGATFFALLVCLLLVSYAKF